MYRSYVSDSLFYYTQNMRLNERYVERITKMYEKPVVQKSGDEIVKDIMSRHGLTFKEGGTTG